MLSATVFDDYNRLLGRLSDQSVRKHFDAYTDVAWDDPQFAIDPQDPRWELPAWDELAARAGIARSQRRCVTASVSI